MRSASRLAVRRTRFALLFLATVALAAPYSQGQDDPPKNYLTFKVGYVGTAHATKNQNQGFESETTIVFADQFSGMIEVRPARSADGVTWSARSDSVSIEGSISETSTTRSNLTGEGDVHATETRIITYTGYPVCKANVENAFVKIRADEKLYDIQFILMPDMATTWEAVLESHEHNIVGAPSLGGDRKEKTIPSQAAPLDTGPAQMNLGFSNYSMGVDVKGETLSGKAGVLAGSKRIPVPRPADWKGSWDIALEVTWRIDVSLPPVELVVTIPDYAQWRPEGSIEKPAEPGNSLMARATLKSKVGKEKLLPEVKSIRFQLLDTSREPGVCLNWPLDAKDEDYDLRLAVVAGGTLSKSDQVIEIIGPKKNEEGQSYAEVRIDSYDFGGRASLRAICLLTDGREIVGVMKGEGDMPRLPKMQGPDWIAESWRKEKKVEKLAANDDDEKVEDQKDNGDGYTLYEEYRGWVVDGVHLEGDPERKDIFVLNLIGADAQNGIDLFAAVSQLAVHDRLKPAEMSEEKRLMNGNHKQGPRVVDQHGVWIKTFASKSELGGGGAFTTMNQAGVAGRPGLVKGIGILSRSNEESDFNKPFNLPASDTIFAYDRAIAHELLHSVGVEHHGEGDYNMIVGYVSTRNPLNKAGRPYYGTSLDKPIDLRTEEGEDVAQLDIPDYEKTRRFLDMILLDRCLKEGADYITRNGATYNPLFNTPQAYADFEIELLGVYCMMHINGIVGMDHGEHSGAEDCLMRYYFAKYYESKKPATIGNKQYYLIGKVSEHTGIQICHDKIGTGVNAPGHKPQSRYGDAGNGDCFSQICPNDAVPPPAAK